MICSGDGFAGHVNCHGACVGASASMGGPHHTGRRRCKSVSLMSKHQVENHKWFQSMLHRDMHCIISTPSQSHHLISPHLSLITRASIKTNFATPVSVRRAASHHCCCGKRRIPHTHARTDGVVVGALMHTLVGPTHSVQKHTCAFIPTWIGHAHTRRYRVKIMIQQH